MTHKQYIGFVPPPEGILPKDWVLGSSNASPFPVVREDGNWESVLPQNEKQNVFDIETYNCTGFNTLNAIEILLSHKYGDTTNYSDRWLGIIAGTKAPGNDPQKVAEAIREYGLIPESMLPFTNDIKTVDEYYSFKGLTQSQIDACYAEGRKWLEKYTFNHKWVYGENQPLEEKINNMKIGLKSSPLGIAVYAWASDARDVYIAMGSPNHWTCVYDIEKFLKVIDTYEPFRKLVEQNIIYCKMYSIVKKEEVQEQLNAIEKILRWIMEQIGLLKPPVSPKPPVVESKPVEPPPVVVVTPEEPQSVKKDYLTPFCNAIAQFEGGPGDLNHRNNNPGNIRGVGGKFMKFKTWDLGMSYLRDYVTRACTGKHKAYKPEFTILQFFKVYAPSSDNNHPEIYANFVANKVGIPTTFKIKDLV